MTAELNDISDQMAALLAEFSDGGGMFGRILPTEHAATFKRLTIEAKAELDEMLGRENDFSSNLIHTVNEGSGGLVGGPSYAAVSDAAQIIRGAVRYIDRKPVRSSTSRSIVDSYVHPSVIDELSAIPTGQWDFLRLTTLCRELNVSASTDCHMATAMLVRAICDHVTPVFECRNFAEVAGNYAGTRSFKEHMANLDRSLRKVADGNLHTQIRRRESVPTAIEVDFPAAVSELLREIIRCAK
jgi:hypothetical protein